MSRWVEKVMKYFGDKVMRCGGLLLLGLSLLVGCQAQQESATVTAVMPTNTTAATAVPATPTTPTPSGEADADVLFVRAQETADSTWTFTVTVAHPDSGWEDYANGWDIVLPDGTAVLPDPNSPFTRLLLHPHETEQPFTRSQSNIEIPANVTAVTVRAHDIVAGFGGQEITVALDQSVKTDTYEIERLGD
jgi:hypothetical protein